MDEFTPEQRERIDAAWRNWQSEESRDRGYDFAMCQQLRDKYYFIIAECREENKGAEQ